MSKKQRFLTRECAGYIQARDTLLVPFFTVFSPLKSGCKINVTFAENILLYCVKMYYYAIKSFLVMWWKIFCCNLFWVCTKVIAASILNILVKKLWKSVKNWQSYSHFKSVTKIGKSHKKWRTHSASTVTTYLTTYIYIVTVIRWASPHDMPWSILCPHIRTPDTAHNGWKPHVALSSTNTVCNVQVSHQELASGKSQLDQQLVSTSVYAGIGNHRSAALPVLFGSRSVFATSLCLFCSQAGDWHFHACR